MTEITIDDLIAMRLKGEKYTLLDVREPDELVTAKVADPHIAIPMGDVPARSGELPKDEKLVVMCHHGGRSGRVVGWLEANGFTNAVNLDGGIDAWSLKADPAVPRY
jgi:rhodanese-related sulfurtransferase